jgi:hypothetical protein
MAIKSKQEYPRSVECPLTLRRTIGFLKGRVIDGSTEEPLEEVRITTNDSATYTDSEGNFLIGDSEALNPNYLMAYRAGYEVSVKRQDILKGDDAKQLGDIPLMPLADIPGHINGIVKDYITKKPIKDATVCLDPQAGGPCILTSDGGGYCLPCLAGSHQVKATHWAYKEKTVSANCGTQKNIQLVPL